MRGRTAERAVTGFAAYTGTVLAAESSADAIVSAVALLAGMEATALASSPDWTRSVRSSDDPGTLVMRAFAVQPATDATASASRYGGAEILASEQQREQERQQQQRLAELRRRFVDGPVLATPGGGSGMSDSRGATVIPRIETEGRATVARRSAAALFERPRHKPTVTGPALTPQGTPA